MSTAAAHAAKFYEDVVRNGTVYTVDDGEGYLVFPVNGVDVVPFWSTRSRVVAVQEAHPKYAAWAVSEEPLDEFLKETLPMLEEAGGTIGVKPTFVGTFTWEPSGSNLLL